MRNRFRLTSPMSQRDDTPEIAPERVVFLSVEGDTECDYLTNVNRCREELGIRSVVHLEVLRKADTESSTDQVFALLEEYMEIRQKETIPDLLKDAIDTSKYTEGFIRAYVNGDENLSAEEVKQFRSDLHEIRFDIAYSKYLSQIKSDDDYFGVVVDRDCGNHTVEQMKRLITMCSQQGDRCICFITNPCFEFWLLLHLDSGLEFIQEHKDEVLQNRKTGKKNTFVSKQVGLKAHHTKNISALKFDEVYKAKIDYAIECAKHFDNDPDNLIDAIGINLPILFEILRKRN